MSPRLLGRLEVLGILALLLLNACGPTVVLAGRAKSLPACHKRASEIVQMADNTKPHWCEDAEKLARAEASCQEAYPAGIDFGCKESVP